MRGKFYVLGAEATRHGLRIARRYATIRQNATGGGDVGAIRGTRTLYLYQLRPQRLGTREAITGGVVGRGLAVLVRRWHTVRRILDGNASGESGRLRGILSAVFGGVQRVALLLRGDGVRVPEGQDDSPRVSGSAGEHGTASAVPSPAGAAGLTPVPVRGRGGVRGTSDAGIGVRAVQGPGVEQNRTDTRTDTVAFHGGGRRFVDCAKRGFAGVMEIRLYSLLPVRPDSQRQYGAMDDVPRKNSLRGDCGRYSRNRRLRFPGVRKPDDCAHRRQREANRQPRFLRLRKPNGYSHTRRRD